LAALRREIEPVPPRILAAFLPRWHQIGGNARGVDALAAAIELSGGEIVCGTGAAAIDLADGHVSGVTLDGGHVIRADTVVSNADATWTYEHLAGLDELPKSVARQLRRLVPSLSAFLLYVSTTLDLAGAAHETFLYHSFDHEETFRDVLDGRPGGLWASIPTLHDPSLAPDGEQLIVLSSVAPYDVGASWQEERERWTELMLENLELIFPGIRDHLAFVESATPLALERYTRNLRGAMYGWEPTPAQSLGKRLRQRTPIDGLYLAGHWTEPGAGSLRVIYSGMNAAQAITGLELLPEFLAALTG
jgi:prolycopene isomerase